ncbi:PREDICTED: glycosyltransferase family 92 protein RCOM_0530710-like [Nelumbo nucifera]|uniref:Glycosyltransferase family 92 protein n=2 Tax=Nelumbo nucifera TaxID=4432 RepID=A0A1U7ZTW0_NELNU|nr:PREDICTED: glycosyltransferase family 92 protein RCOM_0530710-like [Nelumbo nucifera]DAD34732.1 TPA_asm: hypothetical protein HUJ06_005372 [Nelumbo nucifera]
MDSEQRRKRKRLPIRPSSPYCSLWPLVLCFCCFVFFVFDGFSIRSAAFRPVLIPSPLSFLSLSPTNSLQDSTPRFRQFKIEDRVVFPDHVLLLVSRIGTSTSSSSHTHRSSSSSTSSVRRSSSLLRLHQDGGLHCVYHHILNYSDNVGGKRSQISVPVLSVDNYDDSRSIVRCPTPPANYSTAVNLKKKVQDRNDDDRYFSQTDRSVHSWETLVYAAALDRNSAVVFVKGLNLRPDRASDPRQFSCHFGLGDLDKGSRLFAFTSRAVTAAQEVIRCSLPLTIRKNPDKARGIRVTIGVASHSNVHGNHRAALGGGDGSKAATPLAPLPSVAKIFDFNDSHGKKKRRVNNKNNNNRKKKHELCLCTMVWNQASTLREWIVYHAWLGVERWFIYDNNSDDNIKEVIDELKKGNYNVSRHAWPWIKTQEAGFSHCVLKAREACEWIGFMDVDEFFYFPFPTPHHRSMGYPGQHSLRSLVQRFSSSKVIGEIRTACHSFGPSGLSTPPSQGVTVGYTCRLQSPERHKSIIRPNALDETLLNVVHHFRLRAGYRYLNLPQSTAVINHYKYQVWEAFRTKFFRRVATYVADWQENQNEGSKDRVPGLGTEAIEPPNWPLQFCEVWDTGLRDFVMTNLADPISGLLPWESSLV